MKFLATSQPGKRMVVVTADVWRDDSGDLKHEVQLIPVVSLETSIVRHWSRRDFDGQPDRHKYASEKEIEDADCGYRFQHQEVCRDVVIVDPDSDGELVTLTDFSELQSETYRMRLVVCDWPQPEDEPRLSTIIADLISKAAAGLRNEIRQPIGGRMES